MAAYHLDNELASMYLSSGKIILHFPHPDARDLDCICLYYHNSAGEYVSVYVYPVSELLSGTAPSITTSSLPDGIAGTPSTAEAYSFTVRAANSAGSASSTLALTVSATPSETQPSITTSIIDKTPVGSAYSFPALCVGHSSIHVEHQQGKFAIRIEHELFRSHHGHSD